MQYVPCNNCSACRFRHQSNWVERLRLESKCWKYTIFFTLTYAPDFRPYMNYDGFTFSFLDTKRCNPELGAFMYYNSDGCKNEYDKEQLDKALKYNHGKIPFLNPYDVQLFVKRLRKLIYKYHNEKFRLYYCGEYGKLHNLPHYHGLLWFNSDEVYTKIQDYISKAWTYGFVNSSQSKGQAAQYTAKYLSKSAALPSFLQFPRTCPFSHGSKNPPIGSLVIPNEEVFRIFNDADCRFYHLDPATNLFVDSPLWRTYQVRLFPLISRYGFLSDAMRFRLYTFLGDCPDYPTAVTKYLSRKYPTSTLNYLDEITSHGKKDSPFYRLYLINKFISAQSRVFNVSSYYYVQQIQKFYDNLQKSNLSNMYEFENDFIDEHGKTHLAAFDLLFFERIMDTDRCMLENWQLDYLRQFDIDIDKLFSSDKMVRALYRDFLSPYNSSDYRWLSVNMECFDRDSQRTKDKNDFLNTLNYGKST